MKLIGISPRILVEDGVQKQFVNTRYITQLTKRGFNTIMIPMDIPYPQEILVLCDGFLITGGADVDPKYFHEENEGESKNCNDSLDNIDREMVLYARDHQVPTLGICRGHQVMNVFLGGSLYQDIGDKHQEIKSGHSVCISKNRLFDFEEIILTNSYHHQALKEIAPGFSVFAKHPDGTIEGIIHNELPMVGVQWHPEIIWETKESKAIWDWFSKAVNGYKKH
jgi:putative glutamine amidotransferase